MKNETEKHIRGVTYIIYTVTALGGLYLILTKLLPLVLPFLIAGVFAVLLAPLAEKLETRLKFGKSLSAVTVMLLAFGVAVSVIVIIGSYIYTIAENIVAGLMQGGSFDGLNIFSEKLKSTFGININLSESFRNFITPVVSMLVDILKPIALGAPGVFISIIVFMLSMYFFIADRKKLRALFNKLTKNRFAGMWKEIKNASKESVSRYLKAQFLIMLIVFLVLFIGFSVMRFSGICEISYMFAAVAGIALLDALPVFGTGTVLIPWAVYGFVTGKFTLAFAMVILYLVCIAVRQLAEPKILGNSLGIHPLASLFSLFLGMKTMGIAGMILFPVLTVVAIRLLKNDSVKKLILSAKTKECRKMQ